LTYIFNKSLSQGIFLERLKYAIVKPLFKMGDKSQLANYRPISLLVRFSELFEILMFQRINQNIQAYHKLVPQQYGFWNGLSTDNASYQLTNSIFKAWNKKMHVSGTFCDLVKVFHCMWIMSFCCLNWNIMVYREKF